MNTFTEKRALVLLGGLLVLFGGAPLAERAYARFTSWGFGLADYGPHLSQATLVIVGVVVAAVAHRRRGV